MVRALHFLSTEMQAAIPRSRLFVKVLEKKTSIQCLSPPLFWTSLDIVLLQQNTLTIIMPYIARASGIFIYSYSADQPAPDLDWGDSETESETLMINSDDKVSSGLISLKVSLSI